MRIALLTDGIWPYVLGGMQKHSYYLCKYLAQQKVEIDLYHFNESSYDVSLLEFFTDAERKYITPHIVEVPKSSGFPGHYIYNSYRHSKLLFDAIKNKLGGYDFIYTKGFTGWYLLNQKIAKKIKSPPVAVKFHGYEMFQKAPNTRIYLQHVFLLRWPVRSISLKADVVFSYGGKITEIIRSLGVPSHRILELPSGVQQSEIVEKIRPLSGKIKFLYLGRYERRKGIEELNAVINDLGAEGTSTGWTMNFIGPIPDENQIKGDNIHYHGEIRDKNRLRDLIRQNDILICPSWSEGMPNVILEAMANGLAVLATDVGATNILVNAHTGWLIENSDRSLLHHTITTIIKNERNLIDGKKQKALELIKKEFTWEQLILKLTDRWLSQKNTVLQA